MSFIRTRSFTCDVTDPDGNTTKAGGTVDSGGFADENEARTQIKGDAQEQGYLATNIDFPQR